MSKTKILDLDKFGNEVDRTITIGGVEYPVVEMSFEAFTKTMQEAKRLEDNPETTVADHMRSSVEMIQRAVPTINVATLNAMPLTKLSVIVRFINGEMDAELDRTAAEAIETGGAEAKK